MKLIVDIDENVYTRLFDNGIQDNEIAVDDVCEMARALRLGTPLDDVISKIEKLNPVDYGSMFSYESHNGAKDMKRDILEILDNIGKADIGRK
jgi:hypothetical protein